MADVDPCEPSCTVAPSEVPKNRGTISWRWGRATDMPALRVCHFPTEVAAGEALYLPEQPSDRRVIAVVEKGGQIIGGLLAEDMVAVTLIGVDPEVVESAGQAVIPAILELAREEGTRFLHLSLPPELALTLADALLKAGFQAPKSVQFLLDTGVEAQHSTDRKIQ